MENKKTKLQDKLLNKKEDKKEDTKSKVVQEKAPKPGVLQSFFSYLVKLIGLALTGFLFLTFVLFCF